MGPLSLSTVNSHLTVGQREGRFAGSCVGVASLLWDRTHKWESVLSAMLANHSSIAWCCQHLKLPRSSSTFQSQMEPTQNDQGTADGEGVRTAIPYDLQGYGVEAGSCTHPTDASTCGAMTIPPTSRMVRGQAEAHPMDTPPSSPPTHSAASTRTAMPTLQSPDLSGSSPAVPSSVVLPDSTRGGNSPSVDQPDNHDTSSLPSTHPLVKEVDQYNHSPSQGTPMSSNGSIRQQTPPHDHPCMPVAKGGASDQEPAEGLPSPSNLELLPDVPQRLLIWFLQADLPALLRLGGTCRSFHTIVFEQHTWLWKQIDFSTIPTAVAARLSDIHLFLLLEACDPDGTVVTTLLLRGCTGVKGTGLIPFLCRATAVTTLDLRLGRSHHMTVGPTGLEDHGEMLASALCELIGRSQHPVKIKIRSQRAVEYDGNDISRIVTAYDAPFHRVIQRMILRFLWAFKIRDRSCMNCDVSLVPSMFIRVEGINVLQKIVTGQGVKTRFCSSCDGVSCNSICSCRKCCPQIYECCWCDETYCTRCRDGGICSGCHGGFCAECRPINGCSTCGRPNCMACAIECARCEASFCGGPLCFEGVLCMCCNKLICNACYFGHCGICNAVVSRDALEKCGRCDRLLCDGCIDSGGNCGQCDGLLCDVCFDEFDECDSCDAISSLSPSSTPIAATTSPTSDEPDESHD